MIVPFMMLLAVLVPIIGLLDDNWTLGLTSAVLAAALMITAVALPASSLARFTRLLRPALILGLAAPMLWMLMQVIPLPAHALANPIWASASAALHQRLSGVITIDIGATLLSLARYLAVLAVALLTTALALDRQRAAFLLYGLVVAATLVAARQIALEVISIDNLSFAGEGRAQGSVVAVLGILLACAMAQQAIDRLRRSGGPRRSKTKATAALSAAILSFLICAAAILISANPAAIIAALVGASTLLAVFTIRRWMLGPWGATGLVAVAAITLFGAFAAVPAKKNADVATALSQETQVTTELMLSDAAPVGSGAGTFRALIPIYREIGTAASQEHPTAAALITIEMGSAFLWCAIALALFGSWLLFNRSLSRGHDYIYAAAGAGALISLPIMAFVNGGILDLGSSLMIGVLCGLALAQSLSGAARAVVSPALQDSVGKANNREPETLPASSPTFDKTWPRVALAIFGLLLTEQAAWILLAERYSPNEIWAPADQNAVATDFRRQKMWKAASIAKVRGDLWAESALATQPWVNPIAPLDQDGIPESALNDFTRALRYSPHRGDVWLMLAAVANRYKLAGYDTAALLKMAYYTAPNELSLVPLRLHVALGSETKESELREMIKRDIGLVLSRMPALKPALAAAYQSAPPNGKIFAENLISEIDPGYLKTIRTQRP